MTLSKANRDLQRSGIKFGHLESPGWGYALKLVFLDLVQKIFPNFTKWGPYDGYK